MRKILPEDDRQESVHFADLPLPLDALRDEEMESTVLTMQSVINLGRTARERRTLPLKVCQRLCGFRLLLELVHERYTVSTSGRIRHSQNRRIAEKVGESLTIHSLCKEAPETSNCNDLS